MTKLELTKFGEFVNQHSVMSSPQFWRELVRTTKKIQDDDGEWQLFLDEKIRGLTELRDHWYEIF